MAASLAVIALPAFASPGHTISFMPVNYVLGQGRPPGGDPVFAEGSTHFWWWFHVMEPTAEAIKVRDRSNDNVVEHNTFISTGGVSAYRDEFCDQACVTANPGTSRQCASYGNQFFFNTIGDSFTGGQQNATSLDPAGETYAGNAGCSIPAGEERLHTGSNTLNG